MILADKIIDLRKKNGWSQEELAEKLGVSRQAVSKWESAQAIPDLGRVLAMADLFSVTTDYLLRDENEAPTPATMEDSAPESSVRRVSMEEASAFLALCRKQAPTRALAVSLCVLSPIPLLMILSRTGEGPAAGVGSIIGVVILLLLVVAAVVIFLRQGMESKEYEYLEQEEMEITEILLSAEAVHKCAKAHGVSVTAYLAAALVYAVYEEIPKSRLKKPVSLMVPANLRNFFPSASMTNFWSWIEIACDLGPEASFEDALQITGAAMQKEALKQEISTRMNDLVRIERNPVLRAVPLEIKNLALMAGTTLGGRSITTVYSNIGRIQMPPEYETYIERFGFFTSTDKVQMCSCSYGDSMVLGITSKIADSNIERNLMHLLQKEGIVCEQEENDFPGQKEQPHGTAKLGLKIFSFTCIAAVVLCWMMNFLATPQMWWAGYATAGVFCAWLLIRVGYQKRKNPLKNSMWQLIFIMIGAILWDYATGWIGWSVDFAIPLAVLLNGATMQILARAYKMEVSEYLFYLMQSGAAGIVPAILWLTGTVRITWPSVICVGLSVLYLIGLFFFRGKDFMREMQKKFRV